ALRLAPRGGAILRPPQPRGDIGSPAVPGWLDPGPEIARDRLCAPPAEGEAVAEARRALVRANTGDHEPMVGELERHRLPDRNAEHAALDTGDFHRFVLATSRSVCRSIVDLALRHAALKRQIRLERQPWSGVRERLACAGRAVP